MKDKLLSGKIFAAIYEKKTFYLAYIQNLCKSIINDNSIINKQNTSIVTKIENGLEAHEKVLNLTSNQEMY